MRKKISRKIGINLSCDTNCTLVYKYVYALKDLRNAIAHNDVVYDTRFRTANETMFDFGNGITIHKFLNYWRLYYFSMLLFETFKSNQNRD